MIIAFSQYGIKEISGSRHNSSIIEYFKKAGHSWVKNDEMAWCAAFANWVLVEAGIKGTMQLNARSFLGIGRKVTNPQFGDVVIFWRGKKSGWQGHVAFYITERNGYIYTLGGNQSDKVTISAYNKDRLLGYRRVHSGTGSTATTEKFDIKSISEAELLQEVGRRIK